MSTRWLAIGLLALAIGCGGKKDEPKPKEEAAKSAPAPAPGLDPKPAPGPEPRPEPKPPEKTQVQKMTEAFANKSPTDTVAVVAAARKYIDDNPVAEDMRAVVKLLVTTALERATASIEAGDERIAKKLVEPLMDGKGGLLPAVAAGLGLDKEPVLKLVPYIAGGSLDDLARIVELGKGSTVVSSLAKRIAARRLAPLIAAFAPGAAHERATKILGARADGDWAKCPEARGQPGRAQDTCAPGYYGLADKAQLVGLTDESLRILRLNTLAKLAGDKAPKGLVELPMPALGAPELKARVVATSIVVPIEIVTIDAAGVHLSTRPVARLEDDALLSGGAWPGAAVMTSEALAAVDNDEDLKPLVDALTALSARTAATEKAVYGPDNKAVNSARETDHAVLVVVKGDVPAKQLKPVLRALEQAGYTDARYVRGDDVRSVLAAPVTTKKVPEARWGRKETRPMLVHVHGKSADIWPAVGVEGEADAPGEAAPVKLPSSAKPWYKGQEAVKWSVSGDAAQIAQAVRSVRQKAGSGTVVVVLADDDVLAERVLSITSAIAAVEGPVIEKLSEVFPGLACKDEDASIEQAGCRSLFPVLVAEAEVPSSSGLLAEPKKKPEKKPVKKPAPRPKPKPEPKPEPRPQPKMGFCDKGGLARVIAARKGAFKFCYERRLQLKPELAGKVVVKLMIGASGRVTSASSSGSMPDKKVHACVLKNIRKLRFSPPDGGSCVVRWPFKFRP